MATMSEYNYHVYMSFFCKDIGNTFADHIHSALLNGGFRSFRNEDELDEDVRDLQEVLNKIRGSRIGVVIFSENYASSQRCLDELVSMLEIKKNTKKVDMLPIFYNIDPSDVRKQKGSFEDAFFRYEEKYKSVICEEKMEWIEKVKKWRGALKEVADLGGMVSQNQADGYESRFIKQIINEIAKKLSRTTLDVALHPIGLESRVKEINLWLQDNSTEVGILAISGMGGIGKTTIAKIIYNLNFEKFDGSSFLADIRQVSQYHNGLVRLQRQLLSNILGRKVEKIYNIDMGIIKIQEVVCCRKVLLVLDDVDDTDQLNAILVMRDWFYPGSKIIITTRNERLLNFEGAICKNYKVKVFNKKESLQFFSLHAFGLNQPPDSHFNLSTNVVRYCSGNPLALKVLGSSLCERSVEIWESALKKLENIPENEILEKLKISYDCLSDDHDQNLFLDIVCFFVGTTKEFAVKVLDGCGFYPVVGIQNLIERCLITVADKEKLKVHQLVQNMGKEIIRRESPWLPGKRSRVWRHKDSYTVLKENTGTGKIKGLILDMQMLKYFNERSMIINNSNTRKRRKIHSSASETTNSQEMRSDAFFKLKKLRILELSYSQVVGSYDEFPNGIRWLCWKGFPTKYVPNSFPLENLVALDMRNSRLELVWRGTKYLKLLKILNLSHSHNLKRTPDFHGLPSLEILILKDCVKLVHLHDSIGNLSSLVFLNLRDCKNLKNFPENFTNLKSLEKLIISGCSKLSTSISELSKLQSLTLLQADNVSLCPPTFQNFQNTPWRVFLLSWLSRKFPETIKFSLAALSHSLLNLSLSNCNLHDNAISDDLSSLSSLQFLNLSENPIFYLPKSIIRLNTLRDLWLDACRNLQTLPELPSSIVKLKAIDCTSLVKIMNLPNLLDSLFLAVDGCEKLTEVQGLFRLEPIRNFGNELINIFGDFSLDLVEDFDVELFNKMTETKIILSVQGLVEFDIFSTFLPGNDVLSHFNYFSELGSLVVSLNLRVEPKTKILGLNVCIVYSRSSDRKFRFWGESQFGKWYTYYIKVSNVTKGLKWVYGPAFVGIPGPNEDITFLSHWKFGNDELEVGDEVNVSVVGWSFTFQMKKLGVSVVYEKQDEEFLATELDQGVGERFGLYQLGGKGYFYSNPDYFAAKSRGDDNSVLRLILHEKLFEDYVHGEGEVGEEEDSDFCYSDIDESGFDEELEEILQWSD